LLSRKWIIIDAYGTKRIVEGEGVIGLRPTINQGESFSYDSWCPIDGPIGSMRGNYYFEDINSGEFFQAVIPQFSLTAPGLLN
jgi:ApaG protein